MKKFKKRVSQFALLATQKRDEHGQGLTEVALFLLLVVVVVMAVLPGLGAQITATFNQVIAALGG